MATGSSPLAILRSMFDLPSRGNASSLTWEWPVNDWGEFSDKAIALAWLRRLLNCDEVPDWLLDLSEAMVGAKVDSSGGIVALDNRANKLVETIATLHQAPISELKEWAEQWIARFDGRKIITGIDYSWRRVSDTSQETIKKAFQLKKWDDCLSTHIEAAIRRAYATGLVEEISIHSSSVPGGVNLLSTCSGTENKRPERTRIVRRISVN